MKDLIATARTSSATMVFSDDSTITLSENTKLEIKEFLFKEKSRIGFFSLVIGKVTANVKKYIGGDNVFEVRSPTGIVGVRGTGFEFDEALMAENQNKATVGCTEGSLNLSALDPKGQVVSTAVLEAGQVAVIIGGVITISAIGAALGTAAVAKVAESGAAGAAGGAGTAAAATTGLSTAAIAGIAIGGAAVVSGAAAAAGGGGGSSSGGTPTPTPTPTPTSCSKSDGKWSGTVSGTRCNISYNGTWITNCSNCSCTGIWTHSSGQTGTSTCTISGVSVSCIDNVTDCSGNLCQRNSSSTFSGNSISGTYSGCGASGNITGSKQ
jgi:hypothetical protein